MTALPAQKLWHQLHILSRKISYLYYNSPSVCLSVIVRKRQVAILARSSRKMSLTVRIVLQYILSRVRVSVRPSIFFICKKPSNTRGNLPASASVYFKGQRPAIVTSGEGYHGWLASNSDAATAVCMCVGVCKRSRRCVRTRVRACACSCVRA